MVAAADGGRWARVLELGREKRVSGGAVGEVAGGVGAFYRAGGEGAEAVGEGARPAAINGAISSGGRKWGGETGSRGGEGGSGDDSLCHGRGGGAAAGRRDGCPKHAAWRFQPGRRQRLDDPRRKTVGNRAESRVG
jgi:hypothetical protein